jgi:hypothetical protein
MGFVSCGGGGRGGGGEHTVKKVALHRPQDRGFKEGNMRS